MGHRIYTLQGNDCKAMVFNHGKCLQNGLKQITLDYQPKGFKVVSAFRDDAFEHLIEWAQHELYTDLITYAADSHVPRAKNAIRFVKERLRTIQSEKTVQEIPEEAHKWNGETCYSTYQLVQE